MAGLYVERRVTNHEEVRRWWDRVRGPLDPGVLDDDMHMTVMYSPTHADLPPATDCITVTPIDIGVLGPKHAVVLHVAAGPDVYERFTAYCEAGCEPTFPDYVPHVTLFYLGPDADPSDVARWNSFSVVGIQKFLERPPVLELGPELQNELKEETLPILSFAEWMAYRENYRPF